MLTVSVRRRSRQWSLVNFASNFCGTRCVCGPPPSPPCSGNPTSITADSRAGRWVCESRRNEAKLSELVLNCWGCGVASGPGLARLFCGAAPGRQKRLPHAQRLRRLCRVATTRRAKMTTGGRRRKPPEMTLYGFVCGGAMRVPGVMMTSPVDLRQISYTRSGSRRM